MAAEARLIEQLRALRAEKGNEVRALKSRSPPDATALAAAVAELKQLQEQLEEAVRRRARCALGAALGGSCIARRTASRADTQARAV